MESKIGLSVFLVILVSWEVHAAVNCTATGAGRFADPTSKTCQNYTLCVYISGNNSYTSYNYVCPSTSVFDPSISKCTDSSNYVCNVTSTNSSSVCTAEGFFKNPQSTNCSSYIECVNINGTYENTTYTCPSGTLYNPNTTLCEANYTCVAPSFNCTAAGRFANPSDYTCKQYYFCVLGSDGKYHKYSYKCPSTSVFNPNSRVCTTSYSCYIDVMVG